MSKPKKCIFITTSPQITSATTFFHRLGESFNKKGYKVVFLFDKQSVRKEEGGNLIYEKWPNKRPVKFKDFLFLRTLVKKHRPTYIISTFGAVNISLIGGWLFGINTRVAWYRTKSAQIIEDFEKGLFKLKFLKFRKQLIFNFFGTEFHTNSKDTSLDLQTYFNIKKNKIKVVNFLLEDVALNYNKDKEDVISFIGRMSPSKGQDVLIKAIPRIIEKHPSYKFYFVGDGVTRNDNELLAKNLNVYNSCIFKGNIPQTEVYNILSKSKMHISASKDEAFGMVNLEAIAFGTPILAHEVGGIPEILDDGINGFFYKYQDSFELSNKINEIIENTKLYENLQNGARRIFKEKFLMNEVNLNKRIDLILKKV